MDKINYEKVGERLKQAREKSGKTLEVAGNKVGVHKSTVLRWENGETEKIKIPILETLAMFYNVNPTWLMGYDVPMERTVAIDNIGNEVVQIPVYGRISAGLPIEMQSDNIIDYIFIEKSETKRGTFYALEVIGDSMDKIIPDGSRVIVRQQEDLENGEIGVIAINGYEATVKRYERDEDNVYLYPESNNPEHKIQRYCLQETPVSILGKVEGYHKKL